MIDFSKRTLFFVNFDLLLY